MRLQIWTPLSSLGYNRKDNYYLGLRLERRHGMNGPQRPYRTLYRHPGPNTHKEGRALVASLSEQ